MPPKQPQDNNDSNKQGTPSINKNLEALMNNMSLSELLKTQFLNPSKQKDHKFWKTQPVPQDDLQITDGEIGPIEDDKPLEELRKDPYPLPKEFEWVLVDIENPDELKDVYTLLSDNYVEDDEALFRFNYTGDFLNWALKPPGWKREWHVGVRVVSNKKLVAFISGIPVSMKVKNRKKFMVEINFLCIHKKLRSKRLAPLLIKEVTRRVNLEGIFQAVYTAGVVLPQPIAVCRYFHRSLNPKKLVDVKFSRVPEHLTMQRLIKLCKVPDETTIPGLRPMEKKDIPKVRSMLVKYISKFDFGPIFETDEEVEHWFYSASEHATQPADQPPSQNAVLYSFVVEDPKTHAVTDFLSFFNLPSSVIDNAQHSALHAAYLFYYVPCDKPSVVVSHELIQQRISKKTKEMKKKGENEVPALNDSDMVNEIREELFEGEYKKRVCELARNALILANQRGFDVFNCLELMDNNIFLHSKGDHLDLRFGPGDGYLNYYFYNWKFPKSASDRVGLVML